MPKPKKNESKKAYIARCIEYCVKKEGLTKKQAAGKCYGMWKNK